MKPILLSSLLFLFAISSTKAQDNPSPEAEAFFNKAMSEINVSYVSAIKSFGSKVYLRNLPDSIAQRLAADYVKITKRKSDDIDVIYFLILMEASKNAREDLNAIMAQVKAINKQKQEQKEMLSKMQELRTIPPAELDSFQLLRSKTIAIQKNQNPDTVKLVRSPSIKKEISKAELGVMKTQIKKDIDSMSEMGDLQQLKMQMIMDRMTKADITASNVMKKFSDTASTIIGNMK